MKIIPLNYWSDSGSNFWMLYNFSTETSKHVNYCCLWLRAWCPYPRRSLLFFTAGHQTNLLTVIITNWKYTKPYIQFYFVSVSLCLQLFVVTFWAWNSYLIFLTYPVYWCHELDSSSPFSAGKALQNHLTHWGSNYLPVHWRCEGNFPKWHTIPWMIKP